MKFPFLALALLLSFTQTTQQTRRPASQTDAMYANATARADKKFAHIEQNGQRAQPDQAPTELTEMEVNAYVASDNVKLPTGVKSVRFRGRPGMIDATARVDFDEIMAARQESNPLLSLFSGVHDVHAVAKAEGSGGEGRVLIQSADIDGMTIPRRALEYFLSKYVTPKYPGVGMESTFQMPNRIDTAVVGNGKLTVTQK